MKRVLLIMFASLCLVTMFGCNLGSKGIPANYSGTDLAKLLLANERLDATLLHKEGDIFDDGAEILRNLAASTSASYQASTTSAAGGQGKVTIEGTTFTFSNFEENCNAYDYFENLTEGVVSTCNTGADMICQKLFIKGVERRADRAHLHQNIRTIRAVFHHAADTAHLPFNTAQAIEQTLIFLFVAFFRLIATFT